MRHCKQINSSTNSTDAAVGMHSIAYTLHSDPVFVEFGGVT